MSKIIFNLRMFLLLLIVQSCNISWKQHLRSHGDKDAAIENAIIDFCHTSSLSNQDETFEVYIKEFKVGKIGVALCGTVNNFIVTEDGKSSRMPTRTFKFKEKLFYWYDENYSLNTKIIDQLNEYRLIDSVKNFTEIELVIDDSKKGLNYFFCKNDLRVYKKVKSLYVLDERDAYKLRCKQ